ncbi:MAG TPA: PHP domain-containing protein, partial [Candidatus Acidoferrales bacterium]|nr:PHP domain-containing protein [Candidatus Acidoferrales bacterium]
MYVELHARSAFSFLEGASVPEDLVDACAELGLPAMALLDRDGVYGAPRFHLAAKKKGVRACIGAEATVGISNFAKSIRHAVGAQHAAPVASPFPLTFRYPLLAASREGYQNLCRLITQMKMRAPKNAPPEEYAVALEDVRPFTAGLICLTGGAEGPL